MPATTDLCDANEAKLADGTLRVLAPNFHRYGRHTMFAGRVKTLKVFEDNSLVRTAVESAGDGRVLVVDGAAEAEAGSVADLRLSTTAALRASRST